MIELLQIPSTLALEPFLGLIVLSFFTSMLTASLGIGGGVILLAIMAQFFPAKALIPVHGLVQLGSNVGRAVLMRKYLLSPLFLWFVAGSLVGASIGGNIVIALPSNIIKIALGVFIIYSVWGPTLSSRSKALWQLSLGGCLSTFITMFVGATGTFVMASLRGFTSEPPSLVATHAACMSAQHLLKVLVFGLLGFAFSEYLSLIILMIAAGFVGTLLGRKILLKINQAKFQTILNLLLTLLALRLIYASAAPYFAS